MGAILVLAGGHPARLVQDKADTEEAMIHESNAPLPRAVNPWDVEQQPCPRCGANEGSINHNFEACLQAQLDQQKARLAELEQQLAGREKADYDGR